MAKYYTFLKDGKYLPLEDGYLVIYSRSRKKLIKFLNSFTWNGRRLERFWKGLGAIVKEEKPAWYKYKNIL